MGKYFMNVIRELKGIEGVTEFRNGLFKSTNYVFLKRYVGNRYTLGANFEPELISTQELSEAIKRVNTIKRMFSLYASEKHSELPYLFDRNIPVLIAKVNGEFIIVDGQNRVVVCSELNIPFYFRFLDEIKTEADLLSYIKRINYSKTSWSKSQQIGSDARLGNIYAKAILDIERTYKIPISNILYFTMGKESHKTRVDFKTTEFDIDRANEIAKLIVDTANKCATSEKNSLILRKDNRFTNFVTFIYDKNYKVYLNRAASKHKVDKIKYAKNIMDYIQAFELGEKVIK